MLLKLFKKKTEISDDQIRLNRLWDLYASGELEEKNREVYFLCDYEAGVNGEGHSGFCFNNEANLSAYQDALQKLLPDELYGNFLNATQSYTTDIEEEVCEAADDYFYQHEEKVIAILQEFANKLV